MEQGELCPFFLTLPQTPPPSPFALWNATGRGHGGSQSRGRFSGVGCRHRTFEGSLSMMSFARRTRLPVSAMRQTDRIVGAEQLATVLS